jgi:tRNA 2-selenouridine synthase SelU
MACFKETNQKLASEYFLEDLLNYLYGTLTLDNYIDYCLRVKFKTLPNLLFFEKLKRLLDEYLVKKSEQSIKLDIFTKLDRIMSKLKLTYELTKVIKNLSSFL